MPNNQFKPVSIIFCLLTILSFNVKAQQPRAGDLENLITAIRAAMPESDSQKFMVPTESQRDSFALIIDAILSENYSYADSLARFWDYTLYSYTDQGNDDHFYYVLMENGSDKTNGLKRGWGTFIFDPDGFADAAIEVPHPYWDTNTWMLGFSAYQRLQSKFFLMAGTHRYANGSNPAPADVAHNTENMFHLVHTKIASLSGYTIQVHGYNKNTREEYADYPDIVLSNGTSNPSSILDSLDRALEDQTYTCGIYDGLSFGYLGATTNKQGQWSNANECSFIHMELEYFIRASQSERNKVVDALYNVFCPATALEDVAQNIQPEILFLGNNYPNPFNPSTIIPFELNKRQKIRLQIFDNLGRKIRLLFDEEMNPGNYQIQWDGLDNNGREVSSGVYWYSLKCDKQSQIKSMHLIR